MTAGVVTFDPSAFVLRYPNFAAFNTANPGSLQMFFDDATLYLNNTPGSLVTDLTQRAQLLNMATAHIALLSGVLTASGAGSNATQVGRIAAGAEGSVSASFDMGAQPGSAAWWNQTQYGAMFYAATARYRQMRYLPPRCRC